MTQARWLIYGAYGYTGELVTREAVRRDLQPDLAGRRAEPLAALADELSLSYRVFDLDDPSGARAALEDIAGVLHCAGPFHRTSRPMVDACLETGTHYLDITGEIGVFESIRRLDARAREAGVVLIPGVGFDVVPSDCLAATLTATLPDASHLELAFYSERGGMSRGTLSTMIEALPQAGAERVEGKLVARPAVYDAREIEFSCGRRWAMTLAWGDLSTAFQTTGIPNIRTYMGASPHRIKRLRRLAPLLPLVGLKPIKKALLWRVHRTVTGPDEEARLTGRSYFWGQVRNATGENRTATLETPEGYTLTAGTAVECAARVLAGEVSPGAWTPAQAFGPDFIKRFPGVVASW